MAYINLPNDPVSGNLRDGEDYAKGSYVYANDKAIVDEVNGNLDNVNIKSNANIAVSKISGTAVNLASEQVVENKNFVNCTIGTDKFDLEKALVPIGTIIPIYDFGGALTFDSDYYAYCNGQSKSIGGVSRTLPDLSNRYIVGFGTEGGADIGSAAWATTVVGNASHQVDIAHTHTGPSHTHTGPSHTHTGPSHTHTIATHGHSMSHTHAVNPPSTTTSGPSHTTGSATGSGGWNISSAAHTHTLDIGSFTSGGSSANYTGSSGTLTSSASGTGATGASGTGNTGASGTGATGSGLSSTQTIQPRSIRCRYIMRIK